MSTELLHRAIELAYERKCAVVAGSKADFMGQALSESGISRDRGMALILTGFELAARDVNTASGRYARCVLEALERAAGAMVSLEDLLASSWFDGLLVGMYYARQLDKKTPGGEPGVFPSATGYRLPWRNRVLRSLAGRAAWRKAA